jgi:hypothetical protein
MFEEEETVEDYMSLTITESPDRTVHRFTVVGEIPVTKKEAESFLRKMLAGKKKVAPEFHVEPIKH